MALPIIVLVGGFLGAGKTSLILAAANICQRRGMRTAAIMNDQDSGLVDTHLVKANRLNSREIAGGCFCCRFSDLLGAADELSEYAPDVIFAEPVGSCIDLSATIIQPLKAYHHATYRVAPLTVLLDPALAWEVHNGIAGNDLEYLFRNQIEEADILCAAKSDLGIGLPELPVPVDFSLSAKTADCVDQWLTFVLENGAVAGSQVLTVDYSRYAEAEAALGWFNLHARLNLTAPTSPAVVVGPFLEAVQQSLNASNIRIAHLKVFDRTSSGFIKASVCANESPTQADGDLLAEPERQHDLIINLRAVAAPDCLDRSVFDALADLQGSVEILYHRSFRPPPPKPQHRFPSVV